MELSMIIAKAAELGNSVEAVDKEIKRNASVRCRLSKMPGRSDYATKMAEAEAENELLKAVRAHLKGAVKTVSTLTIEDIAKMDYVAVCNAIRSIQSKKTHTRWADDCLRDENGLYLPGTGEQYKEACRIEALLKDRREMLAPMKKAAIYLSDKETIALRNMINAAIEQFDASAGEVNYTGLEDGYVVITDLLDKLPEVND